MEKKVNLKQNRRRSPGAFSFALATSMWTQSRVVHSTSDCPSSSITQITFHIFTVLCAPSSRDVCTHDQGEILGGGQGQSVLVWLMGRMRLREGN